MDKLEILYELLGIDENNINNKNIIDELYNQISHIKKMSEFNITIIHEMIKSDLIPPIILKRSQLSCDIKNLNQQLNILTDRYEMFKNQNIKNIIVESLIQEILKIQNEIEKKQQELDHL
jgi:hypothetical protein